MAKNVEQVIGDHKIIRLEIEVFYIWNCRLCRMMALGSHSS